MTKKDVKEFIRDSLGEIKLKLIKSAKEGQTVELSILITVIEVIQSELLKKLEEGEDE